MKSLFKSILFCLYLFVVLTNSLEAQPYGKIFTKQEADEIFGPVLQSVAIPKHSIQIFLSQTNNNIMFSIQNGNVIILDNKRNVLFPKGISVNSSEVFTLFSVSTLNTLLLKGNESSVYIEKRSEVLSVSTGGFTMEVGVLCPPICPND